MIKNSLDWTAQEAVLRKNASKISNRQNCIQVKKLIENIGKDVALLSNAEIDARKGRVYKSQDLLARINDNISLVEEYVLMGTLIG